MRLKQLVNYKKILILGYGKEGKATQLYLKKALPEAVIDHADKTEGENYLEKQKGYDLVIKTPGIPKELVSVPYTTATNIFFANCTNKVIGVTGTKGKSTTSSLIHHILGNAGMKAHLVGNIGNPALGVLMGEVDKKDIFVMELSSYQLDDIAYSPHISVVLNLFPEHMNYHGSIQAYYEAKKNIIKFAGKTDFFIYNPRYPFLADWAKETFCKALPFAQTSVDSRLIGQHNKENIQAAITVCSLFDLPDSLVEAAVKSFKPLPHRLEKVGQYDGITFYDDAISTTPQSTIAALTSLKEVDTLFLGGEDRGYDFSALADTIMEMKISNIVLFPDSGARIKEAIQERSSFLPRLLETSDMKEAVKFAYTFTKKGAICLLSTASPSYSVWKNFEEKGDLFKLYVTTHEKG